MLQLSTDTQAILLLTAQFPDSEHGKASPLTPSEWGRMRERLADTGISPGELLDGKVDDCFAWWSDKTIEYNRVLALLDRGVALAFTVEKWFRVGGWIISCLDDNYPIRLTQHFGYAAPSVLYGVGDPAAIANGGLAIVGSRNAVGADLQYASTLGRMAALSESAVISGGARGIDEAGMLGALENGGSAIGVLADNVIRASSSKQWRNHIRDGNLVFVSVLNPEFAFTPANAMARNRYIYCLADAAVVVRAGVSGGTWAGATENLANNWVPLWVKPTNDPDAGNRLLCEQGGWWLPDDISQIQISSLIGTS